MKRLLGLVVMVMMMASISYGTVDVPKQITLEMILSHTEDGLLSGEKEVTVRLYRRTAETVLWDDTFDRILFEKGGTAIVLGSDADPLEPSYFMYDDLEIQIQLGASQVSLPVVTAPYSLRSFSAKSASRVQNESQLFVDRPQKRIGLGTITPVVKLDVAGAVKIGPSTQELSGVLRYQGGDLTVFRDGKWVSTTYETIPGDSSKWNSGVSGVTQKVPRNVGIDVVTADAKLHVNGAAIYSGDLLVNGDVFVQGSAMLGGNYGFDASNNVLATQLELGVTLLDSWKNGEVKVSGLIKGSGSGLSNIGALSFLDDIVSSFNIAEGAVTDIKLLGDSIPNNKIAVGSITSSDVQVLSITNTFISDGAISNDKIRDQSILPNKIHSSVLLIDFIPSEFITTIKLADGAVAADKIADLNILEHHWATASVTESKLQANSIGQSEISAGAVTAEKIAAGAITASKLTGVISLLNGGTGQSVITANAILFGDGGVPTQDPDTFVWLSTQKMGINTNAPIANLHVEGDSSDHYVILENTNSNVTGVSLKNGVEEWQTRVDTDGNLSWVTASSPSNAFVLSDTGQLSKGVVSNSEQVDLLGALVIGNTATGSPNDGSIRYTGTAFEGHHSGSWTQLDLPTMVFAGMSFGDSNTGNTTQSVVGGGALNDASGSQSAIGGGLDNNSGGDQSVVIGGRGHRIVGAAPHAVIGGGTTNNIQSSHSVIGGGANNIVKGTYSAILGGNQNTVTSNFSTVAGINNSVDALGAVISGGQNNVVDTNYSTIVGGQNNSILSGSGTHQVRGGSNVNLLAASFIGGGSQNHIVGQGSHIGGGLHNQINGSENSISAGSHNQIQGSGSVISGGRSHSIQGNGTGISGGESHQVSGSYSTVQGGLDHQIQGDMTTVGGGMGHRSEGYGHVISGGDGHRVSGLHGTVSGGEANVITGHFGSVSGGQSNNVTGKYGAILGGYSNEASGEGSVAMGRYAHANHEGSFVWSDGAESTGMTTEKDNQFIVKASGGVAFYTGVGDGGVVLDSGSGSWAVVSDRNKKTNLTGVDSDAILTKLEGMKIQEWEYKSKQKETKKDRHIGPMAQDFYEAYGLGRDEKHISTVDADGIALVSIQALAKRIAVTQKELSVIIETLDSRLDPDDLRKPYKELDRVLHRLESENRQLDKAISRLGKRVGDRYKRIDQLLKGIEAMEASSNLKVNTSNK
jgi:trimeric autotransporter adhesin